MATKPKYPSRARRTGNPTQRVGLPGRPKPKRSVAKLTARPPQQPMAPPAPPPAAAGINYGQQSYSGGTGGYDINSDPAVAAAQGLAAKIRAQAQATALAKRKQAAIEYGDASGVEGLDKETIDAASANPFSQLKNIEHAYDVGKRDLEENLNSANLFYSGYRGQQLGEAARDYQNQRYQSGSAFRALNADINEQLANALMQADMYEANAIGGSEGGGYGDYGDYGDTGGGTYGTQLRNALLGGRPVGGGQYALNAGRPTRPARPKPAPVRSYPSRARRTGNPLQRRGL